MARESLVNDIKVLPEELIEILMIENAQIRLDLHVQKLLYNKLMQLIENPSES